jgi:hypothetical protein
MRGTIPRQLLRDITAATYEQVWWPAHDPDRPVYAGARLPGWDDRAQVPAANENAPVAGVWRPALVRAGLLGEGRPGGRGRMASDLDRQAQLMGHGKASTMLNLYVHPKKTLDTRVTGLFGEFWWIRPRKPAPTRTATTRLRAMTWGDGVGLPGLEPGTSSLSGKRSNRLSYRPAASTDAPLQITSSVRLQPKPCQSSSARVTSRPPSRLADRL